MAHDACLEHPSAARLWIGRVLSLLPAALLLLDAGMKLFPPDFVVKATTELGYSEQVIVPLGVVLLTATILYLWPATSALGAILLTGYLGGAVATHVWSGHGWFQIVFPVIFASLLWGGLVLRSPQLCQAVFPWLGRRSAAHRPISSEP